MAGVLNLKVLIQLKSINPRHGFSDNGNVKNILKKYVFLKDWGWRLNQILPFSYWSYHLIFRGREVVDELGLSDVCEADLSALRYICECVSRRAGFMCAAGLTALIKKMDYKVIIR